MLGSPGGVESPEQCGCHGVVLVFPGQCSGPRAVLDSQPVFPGRCGVPRAV